MKRLIVGLVIMLLLFGGLLAVSRYTTSSQTSKTSESIDENEGGPEKPANPLSIPALRAGVYPGSEIVIEETLAPGSNYDRYLTSYKSEGLKIYALLTVPHPSAGSGQEKPESGWPVVVFNHGFIPPAEYRTTERYIAYTDAFSRNGYILFRPDYRGHGNSEGDAPGGYGSNAYTIDVLNALASIKKYKDTDPKRIGMWGHSMGGHITLRSMVVSKDIKAGVIWAGVVASYPDLINKWRRGPTPGASSSSRRWRQLLVDEYGEPTNDSPFWRSLSSNAFLEDISGPLQIHHGTADTSVPVEFSEDLEKRMKAAHKDVELYIYENDDHNISAYFNQAITRSVEFFDKYVKASN